MTDTINVLAETNTWEYNHLKAAEELMELAEVLLKKVNKRGGEKEPPKQAVVDELGDVVIRVEILTKMYGPSKVKERVQEKLDRFNDHIMNKKYIGKI